MSTDAGTCIHVLHTVNTNMCLVSCFHCLLPHAPRWFVCTAKQNCMDDLDRWVGTAVQMKVYLISLKQLNHLLHSRNIGYSVEYGVTMRNWLLLCWSGLWLWYVKVVKCWYEFVVWESGENVDMSCLFARKCSG